MSAGAVIEIENEVQFQEIVKKDKESIFLIYFWASWDKSNQQFKEIISTLANLYPQLKYLQIEAEALPDLSDFFEIDAVPHFLFLKNKKVLNSVTGTKASELTKVTENFAKSLGAVIQIKPELALEDFHNKLKSLITMDNVVVFMKGHPDQPKCGFSRQLVALLNENNVKFGHFDILGDEEVRQGLKKFSNWPTYPQVYVDGELIGGLDIIKELVESDELESVIPVSALKI